MIPTRRVVVNDSNASRVAAERSRARFATGAASQRRRLSPVGRHARRPASRRRLRNSLLRGPRPARERDPVNAATPCGHHPHPRSPGPERRTRPAIGFRLQASGFRLPASPRPRPPTHSLTPTRCVIDAPTTRPDIPPDAKQCPSVDDIDHVIGALDTVQTQGAWPLKRAFDRVATGIRRSVRLPATRPRNQATTSPPGQERSTS